MNKKLESQKITPLRNKNRNRSSDFTPVKDGVFNCKDVPIGYNWLLGYCEVSNLNLIKS